MVSGIIMLIIPSSKRCDAENICHRYVPEIPIAIEDFMALEDPVDFL